MFNLETLTRNRDKALGRSGTTAGCGAATSKRRSIHAAAVLLFAAVSAHGEANEREAVVDAVWSVSSLAFEYRGSQVFYTCSELVRRVTRILRAIGVEATLAPGSRCMDYLGNQHISMTVRRPIEATEENVRSLTTFSTEQELIARLNSRTLPSANDLPRFPAAWRRITLSKVKNLRVSGSDCELLRGMKDQLFAELSVRTQPHGFSCTSESPSVKPKLIVEALIPLPTEHA